MNRLIFKLNSNTTIKVNTACGTTDFAVTGENLGQGSKNAAVICSLALDVGVSKYFDTSLNEICYGAVKLGPLLFQDDTLRLTTSGEGAQDGSKRFEKIMDSKMLNINVDKSVYLLMGKKKVVEKIRREINDNPITYKNNVLKEKTEDKWLGDILSGCGPNKSILATINSRKGKIINLIIETVAIMEDTRMKKLGGMKCALDIWEIVIIPSLINNCGTWAAMGEDSFKALEDIQSTFLRSILAIPKSCPLPALCYESNTMLMKFRVYRQILNFIKHVHSQDDNSLAHLVLKEQMKHDWPGLTTNAVKIAETLGVIGLFDETIKKDQFKKTVKRAVNSKSENELKMKINNYKKLSSLRDEIVKGNKYFFTETLQNARALFRFRVDPFQAKINYKNNEEYKKEKYICDSCESATDENSHALYCPAYSDLRDGKNLQNDADLALYLQKVVLIRTKLRLSR